MRADCGKVRDVFELLESIVIKKNFFFALFGLRVLFASFLALFFVVFFWMPPYSHCLILIKYL